MKRILLPLLSAAVVLVAATSGLYLLRIRSTRIAPPPSDVVPIQTTAPSDAATTPRGTVTIDPRRQQLIGVKIVPVVRDTVGRTLRVPGAVRYDETKQADVNLKVEGWIRDLYVDYTGQSIRQGQPLFTLYSPDLLNTQNEYLLALKTREQLEQSTIPDARQRADQLIASARQRLLLWDFSADDLGRLDQSRQPQDAIVFSSPVSGFVIEKQAVNGLHVMPGQSLYRVADLSTVWVEADVSERDLTSVRIGDTAAVTVDAYPGDQFGGRAIFIYPYFDEKTRTNRVRFEFANGAGRLKPGMYATVELKERGTRGLVVPSNAVLDSGTEQIVFVAQGNGVFEPRTVRIGRRLGDTTEVLDGLKDGERIADGATFFLDSESQLRASVRAYAASEATSAGGAAPPTATAITLRTMPDPPKMGDNQLEVTVRDANGSPIADADVTVQFFMPAMPTMNMPAMRNEVKLPSAGGGTYRGAGQILMAGKWDATVIVTRGGQRLGTAQLPVVAR